MLISSYYCTIDPPIDIKKYHTNAEAVGQVLDRIQELQVDSHLAVFNVVMMPCITFYFGANPFISGKQNPDPGCGR